jgi:PAS domain-containing protein
MKIPADLTLAVRASPGETYAWSQLLLARATFDGTLELLTAAWERVLGYRPEEFKGKTLWQLMGSNESAGTGAVAAILDEHNMDPINLTVRCRDGSAKRFRLHRRFDEYLRAVFIVAEETHASAVLDPPRSTR